MAIIATAAALKDSISAQKVQRLSGAAWEDKLLKLELILKLKKNY